MIARLRELLNKSPWLGWAVAVALGGVAVFLYTHRSSSESPYSPDRMREMVTIRFTDTDDEISMSRGQMDKELRRRGEKLDPTQGIINPKTGKPTGFLFNKSEWEEMIARINAEKEEVRKAQGSKYVAPAPRAVGPVPEDAAKVLQGAPAPEKK